MSILNLLIAGAIVVGVMWLFSRNRARKPTYKESPQASSTRESWDGQSSTSTSRAKKPPIPRGLQIYEARVSVAGLQYCKEAARKYLSGGNRTLEFEREPSNSGDANAIKVIGVTPVNRYCLGYVPAEVSEQIVGSQMFDVVRPRLEHTYESKDGFIDIIFQVLGPKERKQQYLDFLKAKSASYWQKKYYKFFGLSVPHGLTTGQAEQTIFEHRKKLELEDPTKLQRWDAFEEICNEIDDENFCAEFEIKKINHAMLMKALDSLESEGVPLREIASDIQILVDKVFELSPGMRR